MIGAPPRSQQGRPRGWANTSVRACLYRDLYRGVIVWNQTRKRDRWGQSRAQDRPREEWIEVPAPHLRSVDGALWAQVHSRVRETRQAYLRSTHGQLGGRPRSGLASKYLLTGLIRCACGDAFSVRSRPSAGRRIFAYMCLANTHRGKTVCPNNHPLPMEPVHRAVLDTLQRDLLRPEVLREAFHRLRQRMQAHDGPAARRQALEIRLRDLDRACQSLTQAIAEGGELSSLVTALQERERQREQGAAELQALQAMDSVCSLDWARTEQTLRARLRDWRSILQGKPEQAGQLLRKLIEGRLVFTPGEDAAGEYYSFEGTGRLMPVLQGIVGLPQSVVSPTHPARSRKGLGAPLLIVGRIPRS
jgi:hypothetical protein